MLEPHGDHQIGSPLVDFNKIEERINAIKNEKNRYTILMGDMCDNINAYAGGAVDKRYDPNLVDKELNNFERQSAKLVELYKPVKDKILGALAGNHEWKSIDKDRFITNICKPLEIPYLGFECMLHLGFYYKKTMIRAFEVWACHGSYAGMRPGGGINRLQDLAGRYDADIFLHAHTHDKAFYTDAQVHHIVKTNELGYRPKVYVMTGTFQRPHLKGYDSYIERAPKPRISKVGTITLHIDPLNGKIHIHE